MTTDALHTVLVPGLGCTPQIYERVLPEIWAQGPVTIADTCRDSSIGGMAERLLASAPERFALVGFSMGGFVVSDVVQRAPERLRALAFISTSSRPDTPEQAARRREQLALVRADRFDELRDTVFPPLVGPAMAALWSQMAHEVGVEVFCRQLDAIIARPDYRAAFARVTCPTAVIHGACDRVVPVERAEEFAACIPHAVRTIVEGGGHLAIRERSEAVGAALRSVLEDAHVGGAPRSLRRPRAMRCSAR
jgi:pimeloyl-ACP methyl ester carboxylesterase